MLAQETKKAVDQEVKKCNNHGQPTDFGLLHLNGEKLIFNAGVSKALEMHI